MNLYCRETVPVPLQFSQSIKVIPEWLESPSVEQESPNAPSSNPSLASNVLNTTGRAVHFTGDFQSTMAVKSFPFIFRFHLKTL